MSTSSVPKGIPPTFLKYSRWDVISAFHKELRRGDVDKATYWLQVMMDGGAPVHYVISYLWHIAPEELATSELEFMSWLGHCRTHADKLSAYFLYYAVMRFCRAKKWWEDDSESDSVLMRKLWAKHAKALKDGDFRDFPDYVHDKHTSEGKRRLKNGTADRRFEGTWAGMVWRREAQAIIEKEQAVKMPQARTHIDQVTWDEVWNRPEATGQLDFWDFMEANVC